MNSGSLALAAPRITSRTLTHMDNWTFGWTLALIGAVGTMLVLWIMSLLILLIKKIFPYVPEDSAAKKV
jgi:hypothetical protein